MLCEMINHASLSCSRIDKPDFGECRTSNNQPDCFVPIVKCSGRGIRLRLFFLDRPGPLSSSDRKSKCFSLPAYCGQLSISSFVKCFWEVPFLFQHVCVPVHKARSSHLISKSDTLQNPDGSLPRGMEAAIVAKGHQLHINASGFRMRCHKSSCRCNV